MSESPYLQFSLDSDLAYTIPDGVKIHLSHPSWPALSQAQLASAPRLRAGQLWQAAGLGWQAGVRLS